MKRATLLLAIAVLLAASGMSSAAPRRVYVAEDACGGHAYRPSKIVLACGDGGLFATGLSYSSYGTSTATATGQLHAHNCVPNCAESSFHAFPGTLTLSRIVRCSDGRLYYSRARYRFTRGNPGGPASGTADIQPFSHRTVVHN